MKSRLLLTGIAGFAGSHILEHFLTNTDWEIAGIASWKHKGTPERVEEVLKRHPKWKERVTIITHDLVSPITQRTLARLGKIDYIINAAAESHVDRSIEDPVPFIHNNVAVVTTMLEAARILKPQMFIQISTDEVYGAAPDGINHKEWSPILPSNPYSASKACQEAIAISYWRTFGVPVVITNTMNMFGEMQDAEKYMAKVIRAVAKGEEVTVHGTEGDVGSRFYLHARNHADALLYILNTMDPAMYPHEDRPLRFNIVGDQEMNNWAVGKLIASIVGREFKFRYVDFHATRPGHDKRYALDGSKIKKAGWKAPVSFTESLTKYINWALSKPEWL